jgi:hypothetical protein
MIKAKQTGHGKGMERILLPLALLTASVSYTAPATAGATFKIDDTKWVSVGAGLRTSFEAKEDSAGTTGNSQWSNNFNLDNIRLYVNGQIHKYLKVEFNTECPSCGNGGEMRILDAIGKFEYNPYINLWAGRLLVPAERRELNGPFYSPIYNVFSSGTPFEPSDYNSIITGGGVSAGAIGRDDGAVFWGAAFDGRLQYSVGFFQGLRGGANIDNNILYAQRVSYNFWEVEKNPGYYTSGTYYGKGGDILTVGVSNQYQEDGAGIISDPGTFRGTTFDVLLEKVLPNSGVVTVNGEYKNYGISNGYSQATRDATVGLGFGMFEGNAYDVSAMYLFPQVVGIGKFQPYARYVNVLPSTSTNRNSYEGGVNYVIDGHNARVSLSWTYGDLLTKGLGRFDSNVTGDSVSAIKLGFQWQI